MEQHKAAMRLVPLPGDAVGNEELGLWGQHCHAYLVEQKSLQGVW